MQNAEAVLDVLRERGRRGLPLDELYRQMSNPQLYLMAYGRIYANKGAMTPGATQETVDGMSHEEDRSHHRCDAPRALPVHPSAAGVHPQEVGEATPVGPADLVGQARRRSSPPAVGGVLRADVLRPLPRFSPGRGCHTALREVANTWTGTTWFIEGDLADCFGSFDHQVMLQILGEKIHDNRFLRLVRNMCQAGYLEDWTWGATLSGVPQGGVASPVLVQHLLAQAGRLRRDSSHPGIHPREAPGLQPGVPQGGTSDKASPQAGRPPLWCGRSTSGCTVSPARILPILAIGGCAIADTPMTSCSASPDRKPKPGRSSSAWRCSCETNSSWSCRPTKTLITHARSQRARFLGYEIDVAGSNRRTRRPNATDRRNRRSLNGTIVLHVPASVIKAKSAPYMSRGEPGHRTRWSTRLTTASSAVSGPSIGASPSTTCSPVMSFDFTGCAGSWRLPCSRPWPCKHRSSVSKMAARLQGQDRHTARASNVLRSQRRSCRQETAGGQVRRYSPQAAEEGGHHRPSHDRADLPTQGAGQTAPGGQMRALRANGRHRSAPHPQTRRSQPARPTTTPMGASHGQTSPQVPRGLRRLPRPDPRTTCHRSPDSHRRARCWETGTAGSEGDHAEKDRRKLAPRRTVDPTDHLQDLGMRKARYRGRRKTRLQAYLAATVANFKRLAVLGVLRGACLVAA